MPSSRKRDDNGFLLVQGCPISSFGIFEYGAGQLDLPGDPNRIVKVFRPESAVNDPETLASFRDIPLLNDHEMLSGFENDETATAPEDYGVSGVLTSNVYYEAPWMRGDIKVFTREMQADLQSGKKDLSLGYSCDFELTPGVFKGEHYEVVQTNMRGNHIALVTEGRVPGARVLDGLCFDHLSFSVVKSYRNDAMKQNRVSKKTADNAVAQLKALLPALEQFLNEEGQEPEHQNGSGEGSGTTGDPAPTDADVGADPVTSGDPATIDPDTSGDPDATDPNTDLAALITQAQAVLAKLSAMANTGEGTDEGDGDGDGEGEGADATEGLQGQAATTDADPAIGEGQGTASPGPTAGSNAKANDAAVRAVYADIAAKDRLYKRLSSVVGAFDHSAMDARAVASYGVKKLKLKCAPGMDSIALDAHLGAVEQFRRTQNQFAPRQHASDGIPHSDEVDAFINGVKK